MFDEPRKIKITHSPTGAVYYFPTNEKASLFLGKYNRYVSSQISAGRLDFIVGDYIVKVNAIRKEAHSKKVKHYENTEPHEEIPVQKKPKRRGKVESLDEMAKRARDLGISYGKLQAQEYIKGGLVE